jgi:hypothetical protein
LAPQRGQIKVFVARDIQSARDDLRPQEYLSRCLLTKGDAIYSIRSNILFEAVEDTLGRHDFLLAPCSAEMLKKPMAMKSLIAAVWAI